MGTKWFHPVGRKLFYLQNLSYRPILLILGKSDIHHIARYHLLHEYDLALYPCQALPFGCIVFN
jgi:hypothetical protein